MARSISDILAAVEKQSLRTDIPEFRVGDTLKVHAKIVEGSKERVQIFEGLVIKKVKGSHATATFTVRKVSYNIGVERTFLLHSPRIEKIEVISHGKVRRSRLFYLRNLRGKASRIESEAAEQAPEKTTSSSTPSTTPSDNKGGIEAAATAA